ncbi:MAG: Uma2 family endonuclease [Chloroflexi bacterium]|nr:Uma2 family endonuclease [Chloroflexota bacterium]
MAEKLLPMENVVAVGVPHEDYLEHYASDFYEWIDGVVIKMTPIHERHDLLTAYLRAIFDTYFALKPLGIVRSAPFSMKLENVPSTREPDLQIILNENPFYTPTGMQGPADVCIEVVSLESIERDHGTKLGEYEKGGVGEYWIIDPLRRETRFMRLDKLEGRYLAYREDENGDYQTPNLPGLRLHVPTLWLDPLPNPLQIADAIKAMLAE